VRTNPFDSKLWLKKKEKEKTKEDEASLKKNILLTPNQHR